MSCPPTESKLFFIQPVSCHVTHALFTPDEYSAETVNSAEYLTSLNAQSSTRPSDRPSELSERVNRNRSYLLGRVDTPHHL